jgi:cellulose synthase/poly-beta-1,6-N-acetylglucosamine synthase-like glycosyltransferase
VDALRRWAVGVVIPARNEQDLVRACIESVRASVQHCRRIQDYWIVVAADSCTDATPEVAAQALGADGEVVRCQLASAGATRHLGTDRALQRLATHSHARIWLANTDADTRVPLQWIEHQLELAEDGYHGMAGTVCISGLTVRGRDITAEMMADYRVSPDGTHSHVHGANMGLRADAYIDTGGWRPLALAEDHCLWNRLRERKWRLATPSRFPVHTSARLQGRAAGGFASTLHRKIAAVYADVRLTSP